MSFIKLPNQPERRKFVLCVESIGQLAKSSILLPDPYESGVTILEPGQIMNNEIGAWFKRESIQEGAIFVRSPFNYLQYEVLDDTRYAFAIQKALLTAQFCMLLGAKKYSVNDIIEDVSKSSIEGQVKGGHAGVTANAEWSSELANKIKGKITLAETAKGSEPDLEGARAFLSQNLLDKDQALERLFNGVANRINPIKTHKFKSDLLKETTEALEMGAGLKLSGSLSAFGAKFKKEQSRKLHLQLDIQIEFPS